MGQNGRTLKDSLPFIPLGFFRGSSGFSESRAAWGGEERGVRQSCPLRLEKLSNNKISIRKPVTKTNVLSACPEPGTLAYIIL